MLPTTVNKDKSTAVSSSGAIGSQKKKVVSTGQSLEPALFVDKWTQITNEIQSAIQQKHGKNCLDHLHNMEKLINESLNEASSRIDKENHSSNTPIQLPPSSAFARVVMVLRDVLGNMDIMGHDCVKVCSKIYEDLSSLWDVIEQYRSQDRSILTQLQTVLSMVFSVKTHSHHSIDNLRLLQSNLLQQLENLEFSKLLFCLDALFVGLFNYLIQYSQNKQRIDGNSFKLYIESIISVISSTNKDSKLNEGDANKLTGTICKQYFHIVTCTTVLLKGGFSQSYGWRVLEGLFNIINESSTVFLRFGKQYFTSSLRKFGSLINALVQMNSWDEFEQAISQCSKLSTSLLQCLSEISRSKESAESAETLYQFSLIFAGKLPKTCDNCSKIAVMENLTSSILLVTSTFQNDVNSRSGVGLERMTKLTHFFTTLLSSAAFTSQDLQTVFNMLRNDMHGYYQFKMFLLEDSRSRLLYYRKQSDDVSLQNYIHGLSVVLADDVFGLHSIVQVYLDLEHWATMSGATSDAKRDQLKQVIVDTEAEVKAKVKAWSTPSSSSSSSKGVTSGPSASELALLSTLTLLGCKVILTNLESDSNKQVEYVDICLGNFDKILDALLKLDKTQLSTQYHVCLLLNLVLPLFLIQLTECGDVQHQGNLLHKLALVVKNPVLSTKVQQALHFTYQLLYSRYYLQCTYWNLSTALEYLRLPSEDSTAVARERESVGQDDSEEREGVDVFDVVLQCSLIYQQTLQHSEQSEDIHNLEDIIATFQDVLEKISHHPHYKYHLDTLSIRSWLYLLLSRVTWLVYGNLCTAVTYSKQASSYVSPLESESMTKLEVYLQIAEVHEHVGKLSKAMDYIAEGLGLIKRKQTLISMKSIWILVTLRIWHRTASDKFTTALVDYYQEVEQYLQGIKVKYVTHDVLQHVLRGLQVLQQYVIPTLPLPSSSKVPRCYALLGSSSSSGCNTGEGLVLCRMYKFWGLDGPLPTSSNAGSGKEGSLQHPLYTSYINVIVEKEALQSYLQTTSYTCEEAIQQYMELIQNNTFSIDIIRDLRRKTCSQLFHHHKNPSASLHQSNLWETFLFASASCFPSTEITLSTEDMYTASGKLVMEALLGEEESSKAIESTIKTTLQSLSAATSSAVRDDVICCLCIDRSNHMFIMSTYSLQQGSKSIALPFNKPLQDIIGKWKSTMDNNLATLNEFRNIEVAAKVTTKQREAWWSQREDNDAEILSCLNQFQAIIFEALTYLFPSFVHDGSHDTNVKHATEENFGGNNDDDDDGFDRLISDLQTKASVSKSSTAKAPSKSTNASKSKKAPDIESKKATASLQVFVDYDEMKIVDLRNMLKERGLSIVGKKSELVDRLRESDQSGSDVSEEADTTNTSVERTPGHVIFILDEKLHGIPFESLPFFRHQSCSRVPSLSILLQMMKHYEFSKQSRSVSLDLKKSWFALDIENNLANTRTTMQTFLKKYETTWSWPSFVGAIPDNDFIRSYHSTAELFIFCGHGSGDKIPLFKHGADEGKCASALLWGCSSVKLQKRGVHDPTGVVLQHLQRGAATVAGNLWDVTDKDLDKLCMDCMEKSFASALQQASTSKGKDKSNDDAVVPVSEAIIKARDICKLKYAVGSAAVIYGFPVSFN